MDEEGVPKFKADTQKLIKEMMQDAYFRATIDTNLAKKVRTVAETKKQFDKYIRNFFKQLK